MSQPPPLFSNLKDTGKTSFLPVSAYVAGHWRPSNAKISDTQALAFALTYPGKYTHPWIKALPPGRARVYDLLYKTTSTLLLGFACYGLFETTRGAWYIHAGNQRAIDEAEAAK